MRRTRVVRVITRLNVGGPAIQALLLTDRLDPSRYESHLVSGSPGLGEGDMVALRGSTVTPTYLPSLVRQISPRRDLVAFRRLVVLLRRLRPDIVHTHLAKAGLLGRIAARLSGSRAVIHTFHGNVLRGYFGAVPSRAFVQIERYLARLSDRIVSISASQTSDLVSLRIAPRSKIVEIPLGFDLSPYLHAPVGVLRRELRVASATPLVGIVARLVPIKGVDVFLRAAARVRETLPDARFVVVGDGQLRPQLETLARDLDMEGRVSFLGWRAALSPIYADLDVVVLTSHNEGTPVSLIEASAAGRPIVATAVGGVQDVVPGDSGLLVGDGDVPGIADAIIRLLRDRALSESLGRAAREHVHPRYDQSNLLVAIDALYRGILGGAGGR